jgi:predicted Zn-dependent protease
MVEVRRKKSESSEAMLRRFSKRVKKSGLVTRTKKNRYRAASKSENIKREEALSRLRNREEKERLKKIGKYEDPRLKKIAARRKGTVTSQSLPSAREQVNYTIHKDEKAA